mmetsp:Transcript_28382/g.81800  ORF Transcript_28382/g.81800 Transcript_28382/m.81800 type:complete len:113 (-) Transcript_28382:266-604(-)
MQTQPIDGDFYGDFDDDDRASEFFGQEVGHLVLEDTAAPDPPRFAIRKGANDIGRRHQEGLFPVDGHRVDLLVEGDSSLTISRKHAIIPSRPGTPAAAMAHALRTEITERSH